MKRIDIVNEHNERLRKLETDVFHLRLVIGFLLVAVGGLIVKVFA